MIIIHHHTQTIIQQIQINSHIPLSGFFPRQLSVYQPEPKLRFYRRITKERLTRSEHPVRHVRLIKLPTRLPKTHPYFPVIQHAFSPRHERFFRKSVTDGIRGERSPAHLFPELRTGIPPQSYRHEILLQVIVIHPAKHANHRAFFLVGSEIFQGTIILRVVHVPFPTHVMN